MIAPAVGLILLVSTGVAEAGRSATDWFRAGVASREDAAEARTAFRTAAAAFETAGAYPATPRLALARARSHVLAGDTARAVAAIHDGLALAPYDAELQQDLRAIRETIRYPDPLDPRSRVRPDPTDGLRHRVSPWDCFFAAAVFGLLLVTGLAKRLTARPPWAIPVAGVGLIGFLAAAVMAWQVSIPDPPPVIILSAETTLRKGNGPTYPTRIVEPLPAGAELREVGRRGGWVQVEVPGGATGWIDQAAALPR
jgi:hypothetical protein